MEAANHEIQGTKQRLIDTVVKLLADHHELDVSLREITRSAGANVASVNYHFGSKEALVSGVIEMAARRLAERQLASLTALTRLDSPPSVERIVETWLSHALYPKPGEQLAVMARVARRVGASGPAFTGNLADDTYAKVRQLLLKLLSRCLPGLSDDELRFRISAARVAVAGLMSTVLNQPHISHGDSLDNDRKTKARILAFIARAVAEPTTSRDNRRASATRKK